MQEFSFNERLAYSEGESNSMAIEQILLSAIPGSLAVRRAHQANDRSGIDWFVEMPNGKHLAVDTKVREEDWALRGKDDLALETWSVVGKKIGWTMDTEKATDYILWVWPTRWMLISFPMLCGAALANMPEWKEKYKVSQQWTNSGAGGWKSECVFVLRIEVWRAVYKMYGGLPGSASSAAVTVAALSSTQPLPLPVTLTGEQGSLFSAWPGAEGNEESVECSPS